MTNDDMPWLLVLRKATMSEHFETSGLEASDEDHKNRVLHEFDAIQIIQRNGRDIGMIKLVKEDEIWTLVQIQILPNHQRQGFASQLISEIITEASNDSCVLKLSVLKANPARALYERLGFSVTSETEYSYNMQNKPQQANCDNAR